MFSLVAQALAVKETAEMQELETDVFVLLDDVLCLKNEYTEALRGAYVHVTSPFISDPYLSDFANFKSSYQTIYDVFKTAKPTPVLTQDQLDHLSVTLKEIENNLEILKTLTEIDNSLNTIHSLLENSSIFQAAELLSICHSLLKQPIPTKEFGDIMKGFGETWADQCTRVMSHQSRMWNELVYFTKVPRSSGNNLQIVKVSVSLRETAKFVEVIEALKYVDLQKSYLSSFSEELFQEFLKPIVGHECVVRGEETKEGEIATLEVTIDRNSSCPTNVIVLHNLRLVFDFFNFYLNPEIPGKGRMLKLIGDTIRHKFCKYAFRMESFNFKDINVFTEDIDATEKFKTYLSEIGFIHYDLKNNSIPELFEYLKSCKVLEEARNIMHQKILDTVDVKQIFPPKYQHYLDLCSMDGPFSEELLNQWEKMPSNICISKSTDRLMALIETLLEDATKKDIFEAVRQFYTVRNILELYSSLLPIEIEDSVKSSANVAGVVFNNCFHLCGWIIYISSRYHSFFPRVKKGLVVTYAPEAINIRKVGENVLETYLQSKTAELTDLINAGELEMKNMAEQEKAVNKCMTSLEVLRSAWLNFLPHHIYLKNMGVVIDSIMKTLLKKIMYKDKISPELATSIRMLCQCIIIKLEGDFKEESSNVIFMEKLKAVNIVMEANSATIIYGWKKGKGKLAKGLTYPELNKLVNSIFCDKELVFVLDKIQSL
ncbi:hypothetical protein J437_LFUL000435 [Ladona fulva]|uniref:Centromere/kinetochore protein zw10-like protein n=1 Tax=Ladona fulva TaxID=123851 RepID=A0A8K0K437_LADFU|nr:hypothetical protein J437_LFUL000435 [Ladona fulva]